MNNASYRRSSHTLTRTATLLNGGGGRRHQVKHRGGEILMGSVGEGLAVIAPLCSRL
jgi:hypothetical protein